MSHAHSTLCAFSAIVLVSVGGCAPGTDSKKNDLVPTPSGGSGNTSMLPGAGGATTTTENRPAEQDDEGILGGDFGIGGATSDEEAACSSVPVRPEQIEVEVEVPVQIPIEVPVEVEVEVPYEVTEQVPKALYIMLDRSQSMALEDFCSTQAAIPVWGQICPLIFPPGTTKWTVAVDGITRFVNDAGSANLKVALQYFPDAGQCDGSGYDAPAVPMAALPQNATNIIGSLGSQVPLGGTPTAGALNGLLRFCQSYQNANPNEQCVGVLITDGAPGTECLPNDAASLGNIAAQANAAGIQIFAAGMAGANFDMLNVIGREGGGDCTPDDNTWACDLTGSENAFLEALQRIREEVSTRTRTEVRTEVRTEYETHYETRTETRNEPLECEWGLPEPPEDEEFDKEKVNVKLSQPTGSRDLGQVPGEASCPEYVGGGWFYDDPESPARIKVCPETCLAIQAQDSSQVDILLGCKTDPAVLR